MISLTLRSSSSCACISLSLSTRSLSCVISFPLISFRQTAACLSLSLCLSDPRLPLLLVPLRRTRRLRVGACLWQTGEPGVVRLTASPGIQSRCREELSSGKRERDASQIFLEGYDVFGISGSTVCCRLTCRPLGRRILPHYLLSSRVLCHPSDASLSLSRGT